MRHTVVLALVVACAVPTRPLPPAPRDRVALRLDTSEADVALAIAAGPADPDAMARLLATDAVHRLEAREASLHRSLDDHALAAFVTSPELAARVPALRATLAAWKRVDLDTIAARVLAYLPADARIVATVYPVIKPQPNSFVYTDAHGAAVFVYLDPAKTDAQFDNTIAHELHHIGYASLSETPCTAAPAVCTARLWTSAFGEGFAMLAAAGGPDVHPHRVSPPADRARWDRDVANVDADRKTVEALLDDIVHARIDDAAAEEHAMALFGVQAPGTRSAGRWRSRSSAVSGGRRLS